MAGTAELSLVIGVVDKASAGLDKISGGLGTVGKIAGGLALGGMVAGVGALSAALVTGVGDAREANLVMAQTQAVIASTGGAAGYTAEQIAEMAGSLSAASGKSLFGDDDIQRGQNMLLTFTNITDKLPETTQVMLDMAQATGTDAGGAAVQLGKALNDPINGMSALQRVGVSFTEQQQEQITTMQEAGDMTGAQTIILAELNKEFGGSAAAAAAADGGMAMFKDSMGELAESIGVQLLPYLTMLMAWLNSPEVQAGIKAVVDGLMKGLGAAFTWISDVGLPAMQKAWEVVWPIIQAVTKVVFDWLMNVAWPWLRDVAFPWLTTVGLPAVQKAFEVVWPIIKGAVEAVYTFFKDVVWPWLSEAFRHTTEEEIPAIRRAFEVAWPIIQSAVMTAYTFFHDTVWPWLKTALEDAESWINTLKAGWSTAWTAITSAVSTARDTINTVISTIKSAIQSAMDAINRLIDLINRIPGVDVPNIGGGGSGGSGFGGNSEPVLKSLAVGGLGAGGTSIVFAAGSIVQQPGENGEALASRIIDLIDRRQRLARMR